MTDDRQLYVLCDTNAAARDAHLFRKKGGPLLIAMLRAKKAKLLVPEVLRMEYIKQFVLAGDEALQKAEKELDKLKTFCGYDMHGFLPKPQFGEAQALEILEQLEDVIHFIPSTDELKVAASNRSIAGHKPTSKTDHGFKDCLIWESVLTLPSGSEVILLSRDEAAFFDESELAPNLEKEAKERGLRLSAYSTTKNPTLMPLVNALKERFADLATMAAADLPMGDHPRFLAYRQTERGAPVLPQEQGEAASQPTVAEPGELETLLTAKTRHLGIIEAKALGFVGFLGRTGKQVAINLLVQSGVVIDAARNALERLALAGLIKDTGHNYLAVAGQLTEMAAQEVELEMIKLTVLAG